MRRGRSISHIEFTESDWKIGCGSGECGYLLHLPSPTRDFPEAVAAYLREGVQRKISEGYKCRNRTPWFAVPNVYIPDALLSYMSGRRARFSANRAKAVAPNSLHVVRFGLTCPYSASGVAALWQTSLTRLSSEIEGHSLGGGMLKLAYPALVYGFVHLLRANAEGPVPENGRKFLVDDETQNVEVLASDVAVWANGEIDTSIRRYHDAIARLAGRRDMRDDITR